MPPPMGGLVKPGDATNPNAATPIEIEQLLLRFIDVDVRPGETYQYQIRLKMLNPNFERKSEVANPTYADHKYLFSPWTEMGPITIPTESFTYAADVGAYRKSIEETYGPKDKDILARLQVKDNQAVVEMCTWMLDVRLDGSGKREPVGAWVVADMPVGRGEYLGRKQYVKLPLWSSETKAYVLREMPDKIFSTKVNGKDMPQPKGWLVDFSTRNVLVDFEGGRVQSRAGKAGDRGRCHRTPDRGFGWKTHR